MSLYNMVKEVSEKYKLKRDNGAYKFKVYLLLFECLIFTIHHEYELSSKAFGDLLYIDIKYTLNL